MSDWKTFVILAINTAASVGGSSLLKLAASTGNLVYVSLGCACWAISATTFLTLAKEQELGVIAVVTSAMALLTVNAVGILFFGEVLSLKKALGLTCLITGMVLVVLSGSSK